MICCVSLQCPNGHRNGGMPREYAGPHPTAAWFDTLCRDLNREVRAHPEEWTHCMECGVPFSGAWGYVVDELKAKTMDEAHAALAKISKPQP